MASLPDRAPPVGVARSLPGSYVPLVFAPTDWADVTTEAVTFLRDLIRLETVNPPGQERLAVDYLAERLAREGIPFEIREASAGRANLVARIRGSGRKRPLLLNAHLDVVPAETKASSAGGCYWTHPPFSGALVDGYVWGRGAIDMKNMAAMSLMTLILLARQGVALDRDVIFAAVADEEAGSERGSLYLVEQHPELVDAEYVLGEVGGYTMHVDQARIYPIQVSEKGVCWFDMTANGAPGHGSMPHQNNAVVRLSRAVDALATTRFPHHPTPVVSAFLEAMVRGGKKAERIAAQLLADRRVGALAIELLRLRDPKKATTLAPLLRNTASPTMLSAGRVVNVIPSSATARVDGRIVPGQSLESFLAEVRAAVGLDVELHVVQHHDGTEFPSDTPLFDLIRRVVEHHDPGSVAVPYMIPGFTDSFAYKKLGAICYGFSPVRLGPEIDFARLYHGHDERIPVEGFGWGLRVLYEVVSEFCASAA